MSDDDTNVVSLTDRRNKTEENETTNLRCTCGDEWWVTAGIVIDAKTRRAVAYATPLTCASCGAAQ